MNALLSLRDTAKLLSVSSWTIRNFVRSGRLTPVRLCRRLLFEQAEIERFIEHAKLSSPVPLPERLARQPNLIQENEQ